uniref:Uncharacterized protein n=1 Tax=Populus trichocarpa TaxID=3694 RepID=A0A3N7G3Z6_POPTR
MVLSSHTVPNHPSCWRNCVLWFYLTLPHKK